MFQMKKILFSIFYFILFVSFSFSQNNKFTKPHDLNPEGVYKTPPAPVLAYNNSDESLVFSNVNISVNTAPQNEPSVKISKKNPNRVVAAWRDFRLGIDPNAVRRVGYSYSTDGGSTWSTTALLDSTLLGGGLLRNSDATVGVDSAGNFYIGVIALNNSNSNGTLAIYKSTDGGITFPTGVIVIQSGGTGEDKEYLTTDFTPGSPYRNTLYFSWTRFTTGLGINVIKSTNGGLNWSTPVNIGAYGGQGSDPAVGINGDLYVAWAGGNTIQFNKSTNGGTTFSGEVTIATGPTPQNLPNQVGTFPSIATDISGGPRNGYVYVTFCDARNGDADVFLIRSTDRGNTWSSVVRVNNDAVGNGKLQYWPWIAVNEQGNIAILFMDTRNTPNNTTIEAWLARSTDGGVTFTNELLSTAQSPTAIPGSNVRFGDYVGNDYVGNSVVPVWTDERAGGYNMDIYTAIVNQPVGINPAANGIPDKFELKQNYPNPFNPSTTIWFSLPKASYATLSIYNSLGQLLETPINESLGAGIYSVRWDASKYTSGVYFYKLTASDGFTETKKMMLIK
jgi:Secretion system C-terminal sorting domain